MHPRLTESLRAEEKPVVQQGDAVSVKRDMSVEQRAAFQKPEISDHRTLSSESDQGRTK